MVDSRAGALEDLHVFPARDFEFGGVVLVKVEDFQLGELAGRAARPRHFPSVLLPDEALQERVMVRRIVPGRTPALAVTRVKCFRLDNELEALQLLEDHRHMMPATLFAFTVAFRASALVQRHHLVVQRRHVTLRQDPPVGSAHAEYVYRRRN